jgi:hypothetical protein
MRTFDPRFFWLAFSMFLSGCGQNPRIDITPGLESGHVVFNVAATGMNGLLRFAVMGGTNALCEVDTSYDRSTKVVYGVLPTNGNMAARQVFPPPGVTPASIRGKMVTLRVDYQYDHGFAPCVGHFEKSVQVPNGEPDSAANRNTRF